jgi:hypothetical protein
MDPIFFLDHASIDEIETFLEGAELRDKDSWNRMRTLAFIVGKIGGAEEDTPEEFLPMTWDKKNEIEEDEENNEEHLKELRKRAKEMESKIYGS